MALKTWVSGDFVHPYKWSYGTHLFFFLSGGLFSDGEFTWPFLLDLLVTSNERGDQVGSQLESPGEKAKWLEFLNLNLFWGIFGGGSVLFRQKTHHLGELPNQEEMEKDDVEASFLYNRNSQSSESGWLINLLALRLWELWEQLRKLFKESVAGRRPAIIFSSPNNIQHSNIQIFKKFNVSSMTKRSSRPWWSTQTRSSCTWSVFLSRFPTDWIIEVVRNAWLFTCPSAWGSPALPASSKEMTCWRPISLQKYRADMVGIFICWSDELLRMFLRWDFNMANSEIRSGPNWGRF